MTTFQTVEYENGDKVYHASRRIAEAYMASRHAKVGGLIELYEIDNGRAFYRGSVLASARSPLKGQTGATQ